MKSAAIGTSPRLLFRVLLYVGGLFLIALGVAISINSDLGVSPVNSLPYVLSIISGRAMGGCVIAVFCTCIALQILLLGRAFRPVQLTQILFSVIFGRLVDFTRVLIGDFRIPTYAGRLFMLAFSILLIALGVLVYIETGLVPMAMEGFTLALAQKTGKLPFHAMKVLVDCAVVVMGAVLSLVFLHKLVGIREGTVISAFAVGKVIGILRKPLKPVIDRICAQS